MEWLLLVFLLCWLMHLFIRWSERRDMREAIKETNAQMRRETGNGKKQ